MIGDIPQGTMVDGRYEVVGRIGSGGMADVYRAHDTQLGRDVALKMLHRRFAEDQDFVERFRREASHAAGLAHPNVVGIYDRGEWDGTSYIAMELLEGRTLKQLVQDEGPLEALRAIDLTEQILRAARFAHRRGIVHRDLKPHNVMIDESDPSRPARAKVTDFGIARAGASDMTQTGSIMGTAQYLSPEQAQGEPVTARSDLYSIGVVLYEVLTGRVPFEGDSAVQIALQQVSADPVPPSQVRPGVPPELESVVLKALAKDPAARYADADAFLAALEHARTQIEGEGAGSATTAFAPIAVPFGAEEEVLVEEEIVEEESASRRRAALIGFVLLLLALLAVGAYALTRADQRAVPDVTGDKVEVAEGKLRTRGFSIDLERRSSIEVERDRVILQDPGGGERVDEGSTIKLIVSSGPDQVEVPDVTDQPRSAARKALRDVGFKVRERGRPSDQVKENRAIGTSPQAGVEASRGSTVTLSYSTGAAQIRVADVVGSDAEEAQTRLRDAGLTVATTVVEDESAEEGRVLRQNPVGGTRVRAGATVALTVSKKPADVAVPDVEGLDEEDAANRLAAAGFSVFSRNEDTTVAGEDGVVLRQSPSSGRRIKRGSRVTITVGSIVAEPDPQQPDPEPVDPEPKPTDTTPTTPADPGTATTP